MSKNRVRYELLVDREQLDLMQRCAGFYGRRVADEHRLAMAAWVLEHQLHALRGPDGEAHAAAHGISRGGAIAAMEADLDELREEAFRPPRIALGGSPSMN